MQAEARPAQAKSTRLVPSMQGSRGSSSCSTEGSDGAGTRSTQAVEVEAMQVWEHRIQAAARPARTWRRRLLTAAATGRERCEPRERRRGKREGRRGAEGRPGVEVAGSRSSWRSSGPQVREQRRPRRHGRGTAGAAASGWARRPAGRRRERSPTRLGRLQEAEELAMQRTWLGVERRRGRAFLLGTTRRFEARARFGSRRRSGTGASSPMGMDGRGGSGGGDRGEL